MDTVIELYGPNDTRAGIVFERRLWEGKLPFVPQVSDDVCISIDNDVDLNYRVIGVDIDVSSETKTLTRVVISVRRI